MSSILRRLLPITNRIISRSTQLTPPNPPQTPNDPEKPFTFWSRPILFTGTFFGLYKVIGVGTSLSVFLYFRYTDSSNLLLGGPIATYLLRLYVPLTYGERTVGDLVDTALRRAIRLNWSPLPWVRQIKEKKTDEKTTQDPEVIEGVLDQLEGPNSPQSRKRQEEHSIEAGIVAVSGEDGTKQYAKQPASRFESWRETADQFGGWGEKQIKRLRDGIPDQDQLRRTSGEWKDQLYRASGGWKDQLDRASGEWKDQLYRASGEWKDQLNRASGEWKDQLYHTSGEWKDTITNINLTKFIELQQGTLKNLTDGAAVYIVLKVLSPVRLYAAVIFTPKAAKLVVAAWRRVFF